MGNSVGNAVGSSAGNAVGNSVGNAVKILWDRVEGKDLFNKAMIGGNSAFGIG